MLQMGQLHLNHAKAHSLFFVVFVMFTSQIAFHHIRLTSLPAVSINKLVCDVHGPVQEGSD